MKKFLTLFVFLFTVSGAFALSDSSNTTLSAGIAFPYINQDYKIDDMNKVTIAAFGLNLNYRHMKEDSFFGFFADSDIYFPTSKTETDEDGNSLTKNIASYDYFFGVDALAGVYKVLVKSDGINIPCGIGFHLDSFTSKIQKSKYSEKQSVYALGLGAWANVEINVTKKVGLYGGLKVTYDFYSKYKSSGKSSESHSGNCNAWELVPAIGLAFHF